MNNYGIKGCAPDMFVINDMGAVMGGPYKNEESAKRRIRDLKRKDKEQTEIVADMQATGMMPIAPESKIGDVLNIHVSDPATITSDNVVEHALVNASTNYGQSPDVRKLAASSEYGKSNALAAGMNNLDMSKFKIARHVPRQVGCYPAISKHAYQR